MLRYNKGVLFLCLLCISSLSRNSCFSNSHDTAITDENKLNALDFADLAISFDSDEEILNRVNNDSANSAFETYQSSFSDNADLATKEMASFTLTTPSIQDKGLINVTSIEANSSPPANEAREFLKIFNYGKNYYDKKIYHDNDHGLIYLPYAEHLRKSLPEKMCVTKESPNTNNLCYDKIRALCKKDNKNVSTLEVWNFSPYLMILETKPSKLKSKLNAQSFQFLKFYRKTYQQCVKFLGQVDSHRETLAHMFEKNVNFSAFDDFTTNLPTQDELLYRLFYLFYRVIFNQSEETDQPLITIRLQNRINVNSSNMYETILTIVGIDVWNRNLSHDSIELFRDLAFTINASEKGLVDMNIDQIDPLLQRVVMEKASLMGIRLSENTIIHIANDTKLIDKLSTKLSNIFSPPDKNSNKTAVVEMAYFVTVLEIVDTLHDLLYADKILEMDDTQFKRVGYQSKEKKKEIRCIDHLISRGAKLPPFLPLVIQPEVKTWINNIASNPSINLSYIGDLDKDAKWNIITNTVDFIKNLKTLHALSETVLATNKTI